MDGGEEGLVGAVETGRVDLEDAVELLGALEGRVREVELPTSNLCYALGGLQAVQGGVELPGPLLHPGLQLFALFADGLFGDAALPGHVVEKYGELTQFVRGSHLQAIIHFALGDSCDPLLKPFQRPGDRTVGQVGDQEGEKGQKDGQADDEPVVPGVDPGYVAVIDPVEPIDLVDEEPMLLSQAVAKYIAGGAVTGDVRLPRVPPLLVVVLFVQNADGPVAPEDGGAERSLSVGVDRRVEPCQLPPRISIFLGPPGMGAGVPRGPVFPDQAVHGGEVLGQLPNDQRPVLLSVDESSGPEQDDQGGQEQYDRQKGQKA